MKIRVFHCKKHALLLLGCGEALPLQRLSFLFTITTLPLFPTVTCTSSSNNIKSLVPFARWGKCIIATPSSPCTHRSSQTVKLEPYQHITPTQITAAHHRNACAMQVQQQLLQVMLCLRLVRVCPSVSAIQKFESANSAPRGIIQLKEAGDNASCSAV